MHLLWTSKYTLLLLALGLSQVQSYDLEFFDSDNCSGKNRAFFSGGPEQGCRTDHVGTKSVSLRSPGAIADNLMLVFFDSPDCDPRTIIASVDDTNDPCTKVEYKSFEIWDVYAS